MEENKKDTDESQRDEAQSELDLAVNSDTVPPTPTPVPLDTTQMLELGLSALKAIGAPLSDTNLASSDPVKIVPNPTRLKVHEDDIWTIDHREIYRRGFTTLTSDQKDTVLVSLLIQNGAPNTSNLTPEEAILVKQTEHSFWKERQEINFKKIAWWASLITAAIIMVGIVYFASKTGVLSDTGSFNSVLNTVGSIWQQLFGSIPTVSK